MRLRLFLPLILASVLRVSGQDRPPEIPKQFVGRAAGTDLTEPRTVALSVTSRSDSDPEKPVILEHLRHKMQSAVDHTNLHEVDSKANPDLILELVDALHIRWGMFHYQNDFYGFLLLRERASNRLLYCAFRRAGILRSATSSMLDEFVSASHGHAIPITSMEQCAQLAMRPM